MKKALIIIDYVNDFVATDGKLTCGEPAQAIDHCIADMVTAFSRHEDFIVVASDCHGENDSYNPEHKLFPAHCIRGTSGSELYGETREAVREANPSLLIPVDKIRYSAFAGTNLDIKLRERQVTHLYLVGVCSDICVLHTAIDAYNLGYQISIVENGVASFNAEGHSFALAHCKNTLGAEIMAV